MGNDSGKIKEYCVLFPGISFCYKNVQKAEAKINSDAEKTNAPKAIFKINFTYYVFFRMSFFRSFLIRVICSKKSFFV